MPELKQENQIALVPTEAAIKAEFNRELIASNYQKALQDAENITFTKETLEQDYSLLIKIREVIKKIAEIHKVKKEPYLKAGKLVDQIKNDLTSPLEDILNRKTEEYKQLAEEIRLENERKAKEAQRVKGIYTRINDFISEKTISLTNCQTDTEMLAIERLINLEKSRVNIYEEFLPDLVEKINLLTPLIKQQKDTIRQLEKQKEAELAAAEKGDDQKQFDAIEAQEALIQRIEEQKVRMQEKVINEFTAAPSYVSEVLPEVPKARRTTWKFELSDVQEALKKAPDWLTIEINNDVVKEHLKKMKESGQLKDKTEITINGIRFFENKEY